MIKTQRMSSLSTKAVVKSREKRQLYGNNSIQVTQMYSLSSYNNDDEKLTFGFCRQCLSSNIVAFYRVKKRSHMKVLFVEVSELVFFRTITNITRHSFFKTGDTYGKTSGTELEACEMIICRQAISL